MKTFLARRVKKIFMCSKGSHDWEHTKRVYKLAVRIAEKENADVEIIKTAALLHDIARGIEDESCGRVCHAEKGMEMASEILKDADWDPDAAERIKECIGSHRFRGRNKPESLEAKVLFDADKLDSIGAVGIGRAFLFAGEVGAKLHNRGADMEKTEPYTQEDTAYREFIVKLRKVKERIFTDEGRRIAVKRHDFMESFFERLDKEVNGKE